MKALDVVRQLGGQLAASRLETRAARLTSDRLVDWAEATVPAIGKALGDWTRDGKDDGLAEARLGAAALLTVLEELEKRRSQGRI